MADASPVEFRGTERYEVIERLGGGGMGTVYSVFDRITETNVALKLLHQRDPESLDLFKREFRSLQDIQHRNLIALGELREESGLWFFTMELLSGCRFDEYVRAGAHALVEPVQRSPTFIARGAALPQQLFSGIRKRVHKSELPRSERRHFHEARLREALIQLASGLAVLHKGHKVHSDIKPSNIIVEPDGRLVLLDFGIALDLDTHPRLRKERVIGTATYMAPEQLSPSATGPASDCYAVGVVLYEALTGARPFSARSPIALLEQKRERLPPSPGRIASSIPEDLERLCMDLLAIDPAARPTAEAILQRLGAWESLEQLAVNTQRPGTAGDIFVGRQRELERLLEASKQPIASRVIVVSGPSGGGRTALMQSYVNRVSDALILTGRCHERETVPFKGIDGVITDLLDDLQERDAKQLQHLIPRDVVHIADVFPRFGQLFGHDSPVDKRNTSPFDLRQRAFTRLRMLFTRLARQVPVVILIDDIHWAGPDTWALIVHLMREPHPPPLLMVLFMRAGESESTAYPEALAQLHNVEYIRLKPLASEESRSLALTMLHQVNIDDEELARVIAEQSKGHPLFIREIVRYASESKDLEMHSGLLDEALQAHFDRLSGDAQHLLELLGVAGMPMRHDALAAAAEKEFDRYLKAVGELRVDQLVRTDGVEPSHTVMYSHERICAAALSRVESDRFAHLHLHMAKALERVVSSENLPEVIAHHLAEGGEPEQARALWLKAAEQAMDSLAFDRAASLYRTALESGEPEVSERRRVLLRLGEALVNSRYSGEAGRVFLEAADMTEDREERLTCMYQAAEQLLISGHIERGRAVLDHVLDMMSIKLPRSRFGRLCSLAMRRLWLAIRGLGWRERSRDEISLDTLMRLDVQRTTGRTFGLTDPVMATDLQTRALLLALRVGEPVRLAWCLLNEAGLLGIRSKKGVSRGLRLLEQAREIAEASDDEPLKAGTMAVRGILHYVAAQYREADECLVAAEHRFDRFMGYTWERDTIRLFRLFTLQSLGEFRDMRAVREKYLRDAIDRGDLLTQAIVPRACALMWLAHDQVEEARDDLEDVEWLPRSSTVSLQQWYAMRAKAEVALYDRKSTAEMEQVLDAMAIVRKSSLMRIQAVRIDQAFITGRVLLIMDPSHTKRIQRMIARLQRERPDRNEISAAFLGAAVAAHENDTDQLLYWLEQAENIGARTGADFKRQIASYLRSRIATGEDTMSLRESSTTWMEARGIVAPERLAAFLVPTINEVLHG